MVSSAYRMALGVGLRKVAASATRVIARGGVALEAMGRVLARAGGSGCPLGAGILGAPLGGIGFNGDFRTATARGGLFNTDLLVIGCGMAGSAAALQAARQGLHVTMLTSAEHREDCNSYWAQGGIIYKAENDTPELLASDIHFAGAGICHDPAVMKLATEGPRRVEELLLTGTAEVPFDRHASGDLALCLEASHNRARIIHWRDATGKAIMKSVQAAVAVDQNITLRTGTTAVDLALAERKEANGTCRAIQCVGAHVMVKEPVTNSHRLETIRAPATLLATGGLGDLYAHTSNPTSAKGSGFAMALRAGAALSSMEYVQFHPTTLFIPGERSFLLTEALRGEGALLVDGQGRAFAKDHHPAGELAPRDVVSRTIIREMCRQDKSHMYLDISHRPRDWLRGRFPSIYEHCLQNGLDMTRQPLPVVPAAHYFCGGVSTDLKGRTSVPALFAAGEVACTGLHGANRLASTSLLEGLVWGCSVADHVADPSQSDSRERLVASAEQCAMLDIAAPAKNALPQPRKVMEASWDIISKVKAPLGDEDAAEVEEKESVAAEAVATLAVPDTSGDGEDSVVANKISDFRRRRLTMTLKSVEKDEAQEEKERTQSETMYRSEEIGEAPLHMPLPVPDAKVGTYSFHGLEPSCFEETGVAAKINQDRGCVVYPFKDDRRQALLSVFDASSRLAHLGGVDLRSRAVGDELGHGEHGDIISHFVMHELQKCLTAHPALVEDPSRALREAYLKVDERLAEVKPLESMYSGTTAVSVLMREQLMWIANTGDSRAVLAVSTGPAEPLAAVDLSVDQNPHSPGEKVNSETAVLLDSLAGQL